MKKPLRLVAALLAVCAVWLPGRFLLRPYSPSVTLAGLRQGVEDSLLVRSRERYFELDASDAVGPLCRCEEWQQVRQRPEGKPLLALRMAEEWLLEFYDEGGVLAYYGYAASDQKPRAYYAAPDDVLPALEQHVLLHGQPREEGSPASAFLH